MAVEVSTMDQQVAVPLHNRPLQLLVRHSAHLGILQKNKSLVSGYVPQAEDVPTASFSSPLLKHRSPEVSKLRQLSQNALPGGLSRLSLFGDKSIRLSDHGLPHITSRCALSHIKSLQLLLNDSEGSRS